MMMSRLVGNSAYQKQTNKKGRGNPPSPPPKKKQKKKKAYNSHEAPAGNMTATILK